MVLPSSGGWLGMAQVPAVEMNGSVPELVIAYFNKTSQGMNILARLEATQAALLDHPDPRGVLRTPRNQFEIARTLYDIPFGLLAERVARELSRAGSDQLRVLMEKHAGDGNVVKAEYSDFVSKEEDPLAEAFRERSERVSGVVGKALSRFSGEFDYYDRRIRALHNALVEMQFEAIDRVQDDPKVRDFIQAVDEYGKRRRGPARQFLEFHDALVADALVAERGRSREAVATLHAVGKAAYDLGYGCTWKTDARINAAGNPRQVLPHILAMHVYAVEQGLNPGRYVRERRRQLIGLADARGHRVTAPEKADPSDRSQLAEAGAQFALKSDAEIQQEQQVGDAPKGRLFSQCAAAVGSRLAEVRLDEIAVIVDLLLKGAEDAIFPFRFTDAEMVHRSTTGSAGSPAAENPSRVDGLVL